jgi:hypothetical protein
MFVPDVEGVVAAMMMHDASLGVLNSMFIVLYFN